MHKKWPNIQNIQKPTISLFLFKHFVSETLWTALNDRLVEQSVQPDRTEPVPPQGQAPARWCLCCARAFECCEEVVEVVEVAGTRDRSVWSLSNWYRDISRSNRQSNGECKTGSKPNFTEFEQKWNDSELSVETWSTIPIGLGHRMHQVIAKHANVRCQQRSYTT